ncbi:hypothetical protein Y1Q_0009383 [Alligator mississippiensis]|uniref:Uncharacterized protein n=1 Tax=Alligator mississippiensis TaxID=8496 RepID=A0A151N7R4_ALLMI|nr:hypothetical protein Y1Q_0009383 [Alligator mississippiensis]
MSRDNRELLALLPKIAGQGEDLEKDWPESAPGISSLPSLLDFLHSPSNLPWKDAACDGNRGWTANGDPTKIWARGC